MDSSRLLLTKTFHRKPNNGKTPGYRGNHVLKVLNLRPGSGCQGSGREDTARPRA